MKEFRGSSGRAAKPRRVESGKALFLKGIEHATYLRILSTEHTTHSLAHAEGVSVPTMARALARLRRSLRPAGMELVSVRVPPPGGGYRFEMRGHDEYVKRAWQRSRLRGLAGCVKSSKDSPPLKPEDEVIYGRDW